MGTVKYTGPVASFHCPTNAEIRSLKVHFSPKQLGEGDPSPENVREIVGWEGVKVWQSGDNQGSTTDYEFGVLGKNKLDPTWESGGINTNTGSAQTGSNSIRLKDKIKIFPNTTYTISWSSTGRNIYRFAYKKDGTFSRYLGLQSVSGQTVKFNTDEYYLWIYQYNNINEPENLQIELGSTATTYEPYDPKHTVYGGWVDLITGEVVKTWAARPISQMSVVKTKGTGVQQHRFDLRAPWVTGVGYEDAGGAYQAICSIFSFGTAETNFIYRTYAGLIDVYDDTTETAEDFKTKYGDYTVAYNIRSELYEHYHLAPTQLQTFLGQNNVWSNADYVEVEYDLHETQDILARKQFIIANQPHLEEISGSIATFNTDISAPLKECKVEFKPVQDLHGYGNSWPGGGGKNIAKPYDNSYVSSTYVSFDYSAENGTFRCYGTASVSSTHSSPSATNAANNGATFTLPAGTYTLSIIDGDGANIYAQCVSSTETVLAETTSYITFTTNESLTVFVRLKVAAAATVDKTVKIQLEKGSFATTYEPYENACPISGWTGLEVYSAGKNLINPDLYTLKVQPDTTNKVLKSASVYGVLSVPVPTGTSLHFSKNTNMGSYFLYGAVEEAKIGSTYTGGWTATNYLNLTVTEQNNTGKYVYVITGNNYIVTAWENVEAQVEIGEEKTSYEKPSGKKFIIDWSNSAGTLYGGHVDLMKGEVVQTWKELDLSTTKWNYIASTNRFETQYLYDADKTKGLITAISDMYLSVINQTGANFNTNIGDMTMCFNTSAGYPYIVLHDSRFTSAEELIDSFSGHQMFYKLAEPIHYSIDPIILKALRGINNIWSNSNGNIELSYWTH